MNLREKLQKLAKEKILAQQKTIESVELKSVKQPRIVQKRVSAPKKRVEQITVIRKAFFPEIPSEFQYRRPAEASIKSDRLIELLEKFNEKKVRKTVKKVQLSEFTFFEKRQMPRTNN